MRGVELLHPETRKKADKLVELSLKQGLKVKITDTLRTKQEQDYLYAQGRTKPGNIVTNVKYPNSVHSWYHAFDICRNDGLGAYNDNDGFFTKVGKIGESIGLEWGGRWTSLVDKPHYQDKEYLMGSVSPSKLIVKYGTPEKYKMTWKITETQIPVKEEIIIEEEDDDTVLYVKYENIPTWGQPTIKKLMDKKLLLGNEKNEINLTDSILRVLVINDRAKLYD